MVYVRSLLIRVRRGQRPPIGEADTDQDVDPSRIAKHVYS